jgi:hypothetical protein
MERLDYSLVSLLGHQGKLHVPFQKLSKDVIALVMIRLMM